jgi:hypothetical protein
VVLSTRVEDLESGVRLEVMVKSRPGDRKTRTKLD